MFSDLSLKTKNKIDLLPVFSLRYVSKAHGGRELTIVFGESEHDCVVFTDKELLKGPTYEIRGDGIWFDANCEIPNEHWSFSMESFALRIPVDEYLSHLESPDSLLIGDRIPFGFELDAVSTSEDDWKLSGEVLVGKEEIDFSDQVCQLILR